ncbi:GSCOCG00010439001-RA-CDS [Cotesia congregata]|nr:GSCOCG00010439001-RA-CDS [Cotesia congregata]
MPDNSSDTPFYVTNFRGSLYVVVSKSHSESCYIPRVHAKKRKKTDNSLSNTMGGSKYMFIADE